MVDQQPFEQMGKNRRLQVTFWGRVSGKLRALGHYLDVVGMACWAYMVHKRLINVNRYIALNDQGKYRVLIKFTSGNNDFDFRGMSAKQAKTIYGVVKKLQPTEWLEMDTPGAKFGIKGGRVAGAMLIEQTDKGNIIHAQFARERTNGSKANLPA